MYEEFNRKWMKDEGIQERKIEDSYMAAAVKELGVYKVLEKMNRALKNPRFEVGFQFTKVNTKFIAEPHGDLILFFIELAFAKSENSDAVKVGITGFGDIEETNEDETHVTYYMQLHQGPNVFTMNEVVECINESLGPDIEQRMHTLGIKDYRCSFEIEKRVV